MLRHVANVVKGYRTQDGAGVSLVRVLGDQTARDFDPFLMLDSFDSTNPDDYTAGFPLHPHRGIETVSYLREGAMHHRDTMGFEDTVTSGEVQWMCAGSGVEHEETIPAARRLLGVQLWLNLPAAEKMAQPTYHAVKRDDIESVPLDGAVLRLLAGRYVDENGKSHQGFVGSHLPLDYYELTVEAGYRRSAAQSADPPRRMRSPCAMGPITAEMFSHAALGLPGRFTTSVPPRMPAVSRERQACGVMAIDAARMASGMPGAMRSHTAAVASGVTSRGEKPVPPVVRTSATSAPAAPRMASSI